MSQGTTDPHDAVRRELLNLLLEKVDHDPYPSSTMMNMVEELLEPDEVAEYAEVLMRKIRLDEFPSLDLIKRVMEV